MNLFVVAPDYDHNWRTASFACCINDGAKERFAAKWEQLLWLHKPRRSASSQDNRSCHAEQNEAASKNSARSSLTAATGFLDSGRNDSYAFARTGMLPSHNESP